MKDKTIIINLGRQFASGGRYIARQLCDEFGCRYCDKEILVMAAKESGFTPAIFKKNDEKKHFFKSFFHMNIPIMSDDNFYGNNFSEDSLFQFQCEAIRKAASEESCLFIGRCADYVLRDMPNAVSIFLSANMEDRVKRTMERHQVDEATATKIISKKDSSRASFYEYYTGKKWGYSESYDLCLNTSVLGLDDSEHFIADFIRKRFGIE